MTQLSDSEQKILREINQSSLKFLVPLTPEEAYETIVSEARKLVKAEYGSILLETDGKLERVYVSDSRLLSIGVRKRGFTYKAFKTKEPYVIGIKDIVKVHPNIKELKVKITIFIPLSYRDKSIGVLSLDSHSKESFTGRELGVLKIFGSMASLAIRNAQLYNEMQKALETRDMFISLASHEFRTPLTSINGYIQLLYSKLSKQDTAEAKWVRELYTESGRLTTLVTELLEINRIKQGQLHFVLRECDISKIVQEAVARLENSSPRHKLVVQNSVVGGKGKMIGDCDKLLQMITALLSNAIKFSREGTTVTITLKGQRKLFVLRIQDMGEGIDDHDLPRIFNEFYKGTKHNHKEGLGVGLLLAKHVINYHKGTIDVRSRLKKGTTVEVKLPRYNHES